MRRVIQSCSTPEKCGRSYIKYLGYPSTDKNTPLFGIINLLKIGRKPFLWKSWLERNLNRIGDLHKDGVFYSFQEISEHFGLKEKGDFWRYLQLRSSIGDRITCVGNVT